MYANADVSYLKGMLQQQIPRYLPRYLFSIDIGGLIYKVKFSCYKIFQKNL